MSKEDKERAKKWTNELMRAAASMQQRVDYHASQIPEGYDFEDDSIPEEEKEKVYDSCWAVWSIEEEWILDPEVRKELSSVQLDDDDEAA